MYKFNKSLSWRTLQCEKPKIFIVMTADISWLFCPAERRFTSHKYTNVLKIHRWFKQKSSQLITKLQTFYIFLLSWSSISSALLFLGRSNLKSHRLSKNQFVTPDYWKNNKKFKLHLEVFKARHFIYFGWCQFNNALTNKPTPVTIWRIVRCCRNSNRLSAESVASNAYDNSNSSTPTCFD